MGPKRILRLAKTLHNPEFCIERSNLTSYTQYGQYECKKVSKYVSRINDASNKINDLKINISEAVVIHALNNLDSNFRLY